MLSIVMSIIFISSVIMISAVMISAAIPSVVNLSVIMMIAVMLNAVISCVVILTGVAPNSFFLSFLFEGSSGTSELAVQDDRRVHPGVDVIKLVYVRHSQSTNKLECLSRESLFSHILGCKGLPAENYFS
jgi:hypothetical protein